VPPAKSRLSACAADFDRLREIANPRETANDVWGQTEKVRDSMRVEEGLIKLW
jgi:hypothetical protein